MLIVEDNELNLKLYTIILKKFDLKILIAREGNKALTMIFNEKPDLVILDIQIPGMSGLDIAKKVRSYPEFNCMPLIAVTAYSMSGDKEKILNAGCNYYISKPLDTREFAKAIQNILEMKL